MGKQINELANIPVANEDAKLALPLLHAAKPSLLRNSQLLLSHDSFAAHNTVCAKLRIFNDNGYSVAVGKAVKLMLRDMGLGRYHSAIFSKG